MMTREQLEAAIADLEEARLLRLKGKSRRRVAYEGTMVETELPSLAEIDQAIAGYRARLARLLGQRSPLGPVRPGLGARY